MIHNRRRLLMRKRRQLPRLLSLSIHLSRPSSHLLPSPKLRSVAGTTSLGKLARASVAGPELPLEWGVVTTGIGSGSIILEAGCPYFLLNWHCFFLTRRGVATYQSIRNWQWHIRCFLSFDSMNRCTRFWLIIRIVCSYLWASKRRFFHGSRIGMHHLRCAWANSCLLLRCVLI